MTEDQKQFVEYLEKTSREVAKWPKWKRNILGRTRAESPLNEPPTTGSVMGCSMEDQSVPDAEQGRASGNQPLPGSAAVTTANTSGRRTDGSADSAVSPAINGCRYNWVGDRMRERLDALEKERDELVIDNTLLTSALELYKAERPNCPQLNILDP